MKAHNVLLISDLQSTARAAFEQAGYEVHEFSDVDDEPLLVHRIAEAHVIGIGPTSRLKLTRDKLRCGHRLLAIGCFGVDTSCVDMDTANEMGISVFHSPYGDSAGTAEFVIGMVVALARQLGDRNWEMHHGTWQKKAAGCYEARGKTLGLLGYSPTASLLGVLAESIGMHVCWFDHQSLMPLGNSMACTDIDEVLRSADFISVHWKGRLEESQVLSTSHFQQMKRGSFFINVGNPDAVDLTALTESLRSGHIAGAALDVFPEDLNKKKSGDACQLSQLPNVILTPHIADVSVEARDQIGSEIATQIIRHLQEGRTIGSANLPPIDTLPIKGGCRRIINIHRNVRGIVQEIDYVVSQFNLNIAKQVINTYGDMGYLIMDIDVKEITPDLIGELATMANTIRCRIL